ncbi:MAG TPA: hypothetical protein VNS09_07295 [Solirubrobacter sp.]|nr:hypothetical protein [Solirubrobacter sp.]
MTPDTIAIQLHADAQAVMLAEYREALTSHRETIARLAVEVRELRATIAGQGS